MATPFLVRRRQPYIDEQIFLNTIAHYRRDEDQGEQKLTENGHVPREQSVILGFLANFLWCEFQLRYTAGDPLPDLAELLTKVVAAYEREAESSARLPDDEYIPVFAMDDPIDEYVDFIGLISACVLLHREDLLPRVYTLVAGGAYDAVDLVVEELLVFYLPDRPPVDEWFWNKPYGLLVDVIDSDTPAAKTQAMKKYVSKWYSSMKGLAHFWGKHEKMKPEYSSYVGYWAFCAAAFTYLYDIDDSAYRDELVYPKDLVDYARKTPPPAAKATGGA
ncbi:hypothetical protein ASD15_00815 [Massilia sp. Root351]|jgi:hypothetical protein|uniref:PoNe immunity protein domain-containing protein n=1 Tax=Massilia sp. Root351 TaxID=1736522 RepID=UPI000711099B|nr:PoNe immunity protein domain-containing protein [Massilia sp. Root351]KQV90661.1 hypothetical protein ASD15_00815 [Massilia sp. Root351]